jgi:hypothetical protein
MNEEFWTGIIWQRNQIIETVTRPVLGQHLLFGNKNHLTAVSFAFPDKVDTFEVGGQAENI